MSVVVPTRNRAPRLRELLGSLAAQTLAGEQFEVVVVDDGSTDDTDAVLAEASGRLSLRTVRPGETGNAARARNAGWRAAAAPVVAFTDDDCVAAPEWLRAGLHGFDDGPAAIVQGPTQPRQDELDQLGPFSRTLNVPAETHEYPTCNVFYPRALLEDLGGFDERFSRGEDTDLAWRAMAVGWPARFAPAARVEHAVERLGPVGKLRVAARWSSAMRLYARHPGLRRQDLRFNLFWKGSHYLLLRALLGVALARRAPLLAGILAAPYLSHLRERGALEGGGLAYAPYFVLHDVGGDGRSGRGRTALRHAGSSSSLAPRMSDAGGPITWRWSCFRGTARG